MQTLVLMHLNGTVCHMDLTPANIMLQDHCDDSWNTVQVIDFGFAAFFKPGKHTEFD